MARLSTFQVPQSSVLGPVLFILFKENPCLTLFGAIPLSLSLLQITLRFKTPPFHRTCNVQYLPRIPVSQSDSDIQTWMLENKLKLRMTKQRLFSSFKSFPPIPVSKPTTTSDCGHEFSLSSSIFCRKWFYITDDMSVELYVTCTSTRLTLLKLAPFRLSLRNYKRFKTWLQDSCSKLLITLHELPIHAGIR